MTDPHPIFGDVLSSEDEKKQRKLERAAKLKEMMKAQWQRRGCRKPRNICRWIMPMSLGSDHGYKDDICGV